MATAPSSSQRTRIALVVFGLIAAFIVVSRFTADDTHTAAPKKLSEACSEQFPGDEGAQRSCMIQVAVKRANADRDERVRKADEASR